MADAIRHVVIVGGGTAGWLTACVLAARHRTNVPDGMTITLVESPDIPTVGVGEGTWPTMRSTLRRIGLEEADVLRECDASFKQGSRFDGWVAGEPGDSYLHPFEPPVQGLAAEVHAAWREQFSSLSFADAVTPQGAVCEAMLAPRQSSMPGYAGALNYAYHLDAAKLAALLTRHATKALGVVHVRDQVISVHASDNGDIAAVGLRHSGSLKGDLFVDCTGQASQLLGDHFDTPFIDQSDVLFNDRALVVQVPNERADAPIASQTISTAHDGGWIWDIGLPTRRGVGCVYSSQFTSEAEAHATMQAYVRARGGEGDLPVRALSFRPGHRERFWHRNCVAIGLSAGFLEPLEASAIVLIELSAQRLADDFPPTRSAMRIFAGRFNDLFAYRWARIIEFLKLHYVLSRRAGPYWDRHRDPETIPQRLRDMLELWQHRPPIPEDFDHLDEVFPAASYQYILYGMGFETRAAPGQCPPDGDGALKLMQTLDRRRRSLLAGLPTNRALLTGFAPVANAPAPKHLEMR